MQTETQTTPPVPPVLEAVGLAKSFRAPNGPLPVLVDVSLRIAAGEFVSIRGESGAGKTTLLQILGGLDAADSGELRWNGENIASRSNAFRARQRARNVGFVFQTYHLVPELTALENVILAGRIAGGGRSTGALAKEAEALLWRVDLEKRISHLPAQLSGGECQRVAIARALLNRPALLLADEPTGNLDERTGEEVMSVLLNLTRTDGLALVLVTHNIAFAARAPRQLILRHGRLHEA
ncbi:MAG: ABC transporter ATP-binding protein [Puniceicoccales bacterium]|jgi:predicted ABC-type transport system involved in lysophospholipase L1 biosynthesis ATPase subunit|nr:ABC transporter ATP-binding protein [Puniceicoccales bacterium]